MPEYLWRLAEGTTTIINAAEYGRTIHDLATRRTLILIGEDMVNTAYDSPVDMPPKPRSRKPKSSSISLPSRASTARASSICDRRMGQAIDMANAAYQRGTRPVRPVHPA